MTNYEALKDVATFGPKVLINLLAVLNPLKREDAKHVLLVKIDEELIEAAYFKSEDEARYARRKLRKIARLSFKDGEEWVFTVYPTKDIEAVKAS